jgi:hypothetical protein
MVLSRARRTPHPSSPNTTNSSLNVRTEVPFASTVLFFTLNACLHIGAECLCEVCGSGHDEHLLLLCDACDLPYHAGCLAPPLDTVPDGDWFCPGMRAQQPRRWTVVLEWR